MTRETKVGLLIGMGVILLIGIIVSDTLSVARQGPADMVEHGDRSQNSIFRAEAAPSETPVGRELTREDRELRQRRREPLPASDDAETRRLMAQQSNESSRSRQLPAALALDDQGTQRNAPRSANEAQDVPSLSLSHDWMFHTPERRESSAAVAEPSEPTVPQARRAPSQRGPIVEVDEPAEPTVPTRQVTHEVQSGESLTAIARRYYGNGEYWRRLAEANPDVVGPEGQVAAGAELVIPDRSTLTLRDAGFERVGSERVVRIDNAVPQRSGGGSREITVASGDTLSALASEHLGSADRWRELLDANRDKLDSDTALRAGMTLTLPQGATASRASSGRSRGASGGSYTVRSGDSLSRIAARELGDRDRWRDIYDANRDTLASPDSLRVGQTLRLP